MSSATSIRRVADLPTTTTSSRCVAAGRINGSERRPWTAEDLRRLQEQCLARRPWEHSSGPKTAAGKQRSAANQRFRQKKPDSVRAIRTSMADVRDLISGAADLRRMVEGW